MKVELKNKLSKFFIAATAMVTAPFVMAAAPTTITELASSVDFSEVVTGIFAIAGLVITIYVAWKGAKFVIAAVRGA